LWKPGESLVNNLFSEIAANLPEEICQTLLSTSHVRIERAVSQGHASPPDFWYDQEQNEWVLLIQGSAQLRFEDAVVEMQPGDFINIPAHQRHRVESTDSTQPTIWLAIYYAD
jgi:cupin 2 domain-containing protein